MNAHVSIAQIYTEKSGFDVYMHGFSYIHIPTILIASTSITLLNNTNSALLIKSAVHCPSNHQYADYTRTQRSVGCLQSIIATFVQNGLQLSPENPHLDNTPSSRRILFQRRTIETTKDTITRLTDLPNMNLKKTMFRYVLCRFQSKCLEMPLGVA
ncbi:hypothetical protein VNO77_08008 [Canavalia gladiata]|uniref:Uncharacterized protein n=1 Tax=Canavalia gladiata TaxID=3824 RepID=A0AAN9MEU3_CANGL